MSERYAKLYSLTAELYAAGAPLIVAAGNLLKDNVLQSLLVQLKLHSLSIRPIRAATVRIRLLDPANRPLGEAIEYRYLDLRVNAGDDFGQKTAIPVSETDARVFRVSVTEVIFDDGSLWQESGAAWEPLPAGESLETALGDSELLKQYKLRFGTDSAYLPAEHGDLWRCACGAWNREAQCGACGKGKAALLPLNRAELAAEKDARLAQEKAEREEREAEERAQAAKAEAQAKRTKKIAVLCAAALLLCLAAFLVITKVVIPGNAYKNAVSLFEAGQYDEAIVAFKALGDYKDSAQQIELVKQEIELVKQEKDYQYALTLFENKRYDEAITAFKALGDYKDSAEQAGRALEAKNDAAYQKALSLLEEKQYDRAIKIFESLGDYRDSAEQLELVKEAKYEPNYRAALTLEESGEIYAAAKMFSAAGDYKDAWEHCFALWGTLTQRETLSAGGSHTIGLKAGGTVVAAGDNKYGQRNVGGWGNIVAVSAGGYHTVGLKSDGTVVAVGHNDDGQCDVGDWTDIVAVSAGGYHTVGLKADGTVVAVGDNEYGQRDVGDWTDIVAVSAGGYHTVGLKADGTVVAVSNNDWYAPEETYMYEAETPDPAYCYYGYYGGYHENAIDVGDWTDIVAVSAGDDHTVGLKADGTVIAVGDNKYGQCDVGDWTDIVAVSAGCNYTIGLKADGTLVAAGDNEYSRCDVGDWTDIVAVSAGGAHTVGLKADGTVLAVGDTFFGQLDVGGRVFKLPG